MTPSELNDYDLCSGGFKLPTEHSTPSQPQITHSEAPPERRTPVQQPTPSKKKGSTAKFKD